MQQFDSVIQYSAIIPSVLVLLQFAVYGAYSNFQV
jgi:hypothetical protein